MGRNLKYVSPADFNKRNPVNSSTERARCTHGLARPGSQCVSACYKIFYPKKNAGLGKVADAPKAGCTACCPNCQRYFSKRAFKKHLEEEAVYHFDGHYTYSCVPAGAQTAADVEASNAQRDSILRALEHRRETFVEPVQPTFYFGSFADTVSKPTVLVSQPIAIPVAKNDVPNCQIQFGTIVQENKQENLPTWLDYVQPIAEVHIKRAFSFTLVATVEVHMCLSVPLFESLCDSITGRIANQQFSIVGNTFGLESQMCCAECESNGCGSCEIKDAISDELNQWIETELDIYDHRCRNVAIWADLLDGTKRGHISRIWRKHYAPCEHVFVNSSSVHYGFRQHLVDADLMLRKIPLIGRTPLELLAEYKLVPTGNTLMDIERGLFEESVAWQETDNGILVNDTVYYHSFDNWRDALYFYLLRELRGTEWTKKQLNNYYESPLPNFLMGFPQHTYEITAAGWNPFRYLTKQVTLGFLDGLLEKMKELLGAAWSTCSLIGDLFKRLFDKLTTSVTSLLDSVGKSSVLADCALPLLGLIGATGAIWLFSRFSSSIGVPQALLSACGIGLIVFVMCKYCDFKHHDALRRAQLFYATSKGLFGEAVDGEDTNVKVLEELSQGDEEMVELLQSLDIGEPMTPDEVVIDVDECVAAEGDFLLHTGVLWKLILLLVPLTCVGLKNTVSTAKDLTVLYGGKETAGKFTQDMIGGIQEMYYHATGKRAEFLGYMYTCAGVDFEKWRSEVILFTTASPQSIFLTIQEKLHKLRLLRDQGEKLSLQMKSNTVPQPYLLAFTETLKNLDKALIEIAQALAVGTWRTTPFCVWLYGTSHVGKSICSQYLIDDMLNELDYPQTGRIYARNGTDPFFSCYKNQAAVLYDDFGAVQEGAHFDESEIIRLIAPAPAPLNMPNLEAKGNTCFTSDFVFMTANQCGLSPTAVVHDEKAFENRRNIVVQVEAIPGKKYRDRYRFHLLYRNSPYARVQGMENLSYDQFLSYCVQAAKHFKQEQRNLTGAPHSSIFEAIEDVEAEALKYIETLDDFEKISNWLSFNTETKQITTLIDLVETTREMTSSEWLFVTEFGGAGFLERIRRKVTKAAFLNLQNQVCAGINPFQKYASEFNLRRLQILLSSSILPKVTTEELVREEASFKEIMKGWYASLKGKILELPFWAKVLLGATGVFLIGYPVFKFLQGFWTCASVGDFFSLGAGASLVAAGGSMASSQDQFTKKARSGRDRRAFEMQGSSWSTNAEDTTEKDRKDPSLAGDNPILKHVVGFQSYDDPNCKIRALSLGGTRVLFIYHVWLAVQNGVFQVTSLEKSFPFVINKDKCRIQRVGKKDLVVVDFPPTFVSFSRFSENWLLSAKDIVSAGTGLFSEVLFQNKGVMEISLEDAHYATNNSIQTYNSDLLKGIGLGTCMKYLILDDRGEKYLPEFFVRAQCGSLLLAYPLGRKAGMKILSLHCMYVTTARAKAQGATGGKEGFGTIFTKEELKEIELSMGEPDHILAEDFVTAASPPFVGEFSEAQTVQPLGVMACNQTPMGVGKSSIIPSVIAREVTKTTGLKPQTEPAILTRDDARLGAKKVDILRVGMLKYSKVAEDLSPITSDEEEKYYDTFEEIFEPYQQNAENLHLLSEHENLNGIAGESYCDAVTMSTSEGYPWVLDRQHGEKGKGRLVQGVPGLYSIDWHSDFGRAINRMRTLIATEIPSIVGLDTPKDERLPKEKIYVNPKTRLFTILPFEYNYLVREFFGSAIFHMMRRHNDQPMKVGINPLGMEWTLFGKALHSQGCNWFNGDYSRFDGVTPRCLLVEIAKQFTKLYRDDYGPHRLHLMLAATTRLSIAGKCLYRVSGGIPSGFALTVVVNSLVNQFLVQWSWKNMVGSAKFHEHVVLGVYGDDNICSVSRKYSSVFNLRKLSEFLAPYGFTLKDGSDKNKVELPEFNQPEKCDFLKRSFIPYGDRYLAQLSTLSRNERLFWVREGALSPEVATVDNISSFLEEVFQTGDRCAYERWRNDLISISAKCHLEIGPLPSFKQQEALWFSGKALQLVDEDNKPEVIPIKGGAQELTPGIQINTVCFLKKNLDEEDSVKVWCGPNCPANLRHDEGIMVIEAPYGQKYPLRATFKNVLRKIKNKGKQRVIFGGALDQDLVYYCASAYAGYYSKDFSFTSFMRNYFGEDEAGFLKASVAAKGW